jgi:high-affinity iron transporter
MGKMMGKGPGGGMGGMGQVSPDETDGGKIFAAMCARCHGPAGKGDGPMGRRFQPPPTDLTSAEATKKSDEDLKKVISEGEESMPPFKDNLTAQQIDAVVKFIRALK